MKVRHYKTRHRFMYPRLWINYGPGLTLKEDANWRNWKLYNGIGIRFNHHLVWLIVRGSN